MKLQKTIYLARHGSTAYNDDDLLQGVIDIKLSKRGIRESEQLAECLKNEGIDVIFHSPLSRAQQTAEIVNRYHQVQLHVINGFIEMDMGDWEGLNYYRVMEQHQETFKQWLSDADMLIPGGESPSEVFKRVKPGAEQILASQFSNILIVAHAMVNRVILGNFLGMDVLISRRFRMDNCAISKIMVYGISEKSHVVVENWNTIAHLEG